MLQVTATISITFALKLLDKLWTGDLSSTIMSLHSTNSCQLSHLGKMKLKLTAKITMNCLSQAIGTLRKHGSLLPGVFTISAVICERQSDQTKQVSARYEVVSKSRFLDYIYHGWKIVICGCKRSQIDVSLASIPWQSCLLKHQHATLASVAAPGCRSLSLPPRLLLTQSCLHGWQSVWIVSFYTHGSWQFSWVKW